MKAVVIVTFGLLCLQGLYGIPAADNSNHLVIDGHDLDEFLDVILNRALKPFAKRLIECTPELQRLTINDVEDVLKSVEYTMQVLMRQLLLEMEADSNCSEEKNSTSINA